ncbi:MAG: hypothetical protein LBK73_01560 [Treponema sp.]|nr:hypothetical protein [Treponema sp.]
MFFDKAYFDKLVAARKDTLTINTAPIRAEKAVALYEDMRRHFKYLYDTDHKAFYN